MTIVRPMCAICHREVDSFCTYQDVRRHVTVYEAKCHGQTERVELDEHVLVGADRISMGMAFATKAIEGGGG